MPPDPDESLDPHVLRTAPPDKVPAPDALAIREEQRLARESERLEQIRDVFHSGFVWFLRVALVLVMCIFVVRVWHLIMPQWLCWLDAAQIQTVDHILFSGAIASLLTRHLRLALSSEDKK